MQNCVDHEGNFQWAVLLARMEALDLGPDQRVEVIDKAAVIEEIRRNARRERTERELNELRSKK